MNSAARVVVLASLVAACHRAARPAGDWLHLTLTPASFGQTLSLQQQVHVDAPGRTVDFDAVLEIGRDTLTLVGIALGQRVLTIRYDGVSFTEQRHPLLPSEVRGADILTDVQLALWPVDAVRATLPAGWTVRDDGPRRTLAQDGHDVAVITYEGSPRWQGRLTLENLRFGYRLVIRSVASAQ